MSGRVGIILLGILNVATPILDFFIFWLIMYALALFDGLTSSSYFEIILFVGIGFQVLKWVAFYYIVKYKNTKWLIFYGGYAGFILILFLLGFHYHLLLLSSLLYFVSIVLVRNEFKQVKTKDGKTEDVKEQSLEKAEKGEKSFKDFSKSFRIALFLILLPILYLSYIIYTDWYSFSQDESLFSTAFFIRMFVQTLILVLSWFMLIHLWKNGNSNWRYFFIIPMGYHMYSTYRSSRLLIEVVEIDSLALLFYPAIYLNIGAVVLYVLGMIILHWEGNKKVENRE